MFVDLFTCISFFVCLFVFAVVGLELRAWHFARQGLYRLSLTSQPCIYRLA
jgi:hypothetical protein